MSTTKHEEEIVSEWDCETHGCKIVNGYCRYCEVSADGSHNKPICLIADAPNLLAALESITAERDALKISVEALTVSRDQWLHYCQLGGNPLYQPPDFKEPAICRCDPQDEHEIYGTGYKQPGGSIWCELHSFRHQIAELQHGLKGLEAVTAERDHWQQAYQSLCGSSMINEAQDEALKLVGKVEEK